MLIQAGPHAVRPSPTVRALRTCLCDWRRKARQELGGRRSFDWPETTATACGCDPQCGLAGRGGADGSCPAALTSQRSPSGLGGRAVWGHTAPKLRCLAGLAVLMLQYVGVQHALYM